MIKKVNVELISIGDEILIGQIVNTNAVYLSEQITALGGSVRWITTVGDDGPDIRNSISAALDRAQVVIVTGGLGPTHDDITKKVIAEYFESRLVLNESVLENIQSIFKRMNRPVDAVNREQAMVPEAATVLPNTMGTAPGMLLKQNDRQLFVLPGVPFEMKSIFTTSMIPLLKQAFSGIFIRYKTIKTTGLFESRLFNMVEDILPEVESFAQIAFLPSFSGVNIRIGTQDESEEACAARLQAVEARFREIIGPFVYSTDEKDIAAVVADYLEQSGLTLAVADCVTEGALVSTLMDSSEKGSCFKGGKILPAELFRNVESEDQENVCLKLARNIMGEFESDWGLAIVDFGSRKNLVHFALVSKMSETVDCWPYRPDRPGNKQRAIQFGLDMIRKQYANFSTE